MNQNFEIQYPYHKVDLFNKVPHQINFKLPDLEGKNLYLDIHPTGDYQKLRTLESIKLVISEKLGVPSRYIKFNFGIWAMGIETENQWIEFCKARENNNEEDRFWNHSWYKYCYAYQSISKIKIIIESFSDSILNMEEYDSEKTHDALRKFKCFLENENQNDNEVDLYMQCTDAFIDFYEYGNLGALKILQNISQENFKITLPFLINVGCHLAKIGNFELAFTVLFPIRKEHPKATAALANLLFREGEKYFLNQNPEQKISEVRKKKHQFILTLLKDLKKEDLLDPETSNSLEKSIKELLSKEHNIFNEKHGITVTELLGINISIPDSLWSIKDLEEMSQNIVKICENEGIENENVFSLKNIINNQDNSPEYYKFLLALLKNLLSVHDIQEACSQLPAVKNFQLVDNILPFEMLVNCEKNDIQETLNFNYINLNKAKNEYDRSKRIQHLEGKINLNFENQLELFAQTIIESSIEPKSTSLTNYLLDSHGFSAIKNFPKNSKSFNALRVLSKNIEAILSNYLDYPSDEDKVSAIMNACLNATGSIKGFTLFSKGIYVINNFMNKTLENAKKHAAQEGDLEGSSDEENLVIFHIEN